VQTVSPPVTPSDGVLSVAVEAVVYPSLQSVHSLAPAKEYLPFTQSVHATLFAASVLNLPAAHLAQVPAAALPVYPGLHFPAPMSAVPQPVELSGHVSHALLSLFKYLPSAHLHSFPTVDVEPSGQSTHPPEVNILLVAHTQILSSPAMAVRAPGHAVQVAP
jgi:hypothetical protein